MGRIGRRMVPVFKGELPDIPDRELLNKKALLRPGEAADILRIGVSTVYEMHNRGELPGRRIGGAVRIYSASVREILDRPEEEDAG